MFTGLLCVCAIFRIKHVAKNISLLASRTPLLLGFFLQFPFENILFMFLLHYTCRIPCSINFGKAFKFLSKLLVLLLYGNQYRHPYFVHKTTYLWSLRSPGVGNCLFLPARGWGIDRQVRKKLQIPRGMPRGEMVTGRIEPCMKASIESRNESWNNILFFRNTSVFRQFLRLTRKFKLKFYRSDTGHPTVQEQIITVQKLTDLSWWRVMRPWVKPPPRSYLFVRVSRNPGHERLIHREEDCSV